jgi:hypothetical protein
MIYTRCHLADTVAHDVSARDWQLKKNGGQWLLGKTLDNYAPIGPAIVTKDSIDPNNVAVKCRVNGETLQDGHTREFVFKPQFCLAWLRYNTTHTHERTHTTPAPGAAWRAAHIFEIERASTLLSLALLLAPLLLLLLLLHSCCDGAAAAASFLLQSRERDSHACYIG